MTYVFFAAFGASFLALLWMAKRLGDAGAYKQALLILIMGSLGWCMPLIVQVFVLAAFGTIAVQWWEDTKPAFIAWMLAVGMMLAVGHFAGGASQLLADLNPRNTPAALDPQTPGADLGIAGDDVE